MSQQHTSILILGEYRLKHGKPVIILALGFSSPDVPTGMLGQRDSDKAAAKLLIGFLVYELHVMERYPAFKQYRAC